MKCKLQRKNERYINSRREDVPAKSVECILTCSDGRIEVTLKKQKPNGENGSMLSVA